MGCVKLRTCLAFCHLLRDIPADEIKKQARRMVERFPAYLNAAFPEELLQFRAAYFATHMPCLSRGAVGLLEFIIKEKLGK